MRHAFRRDKNHREIVTALREIPGVDVYEHKYAPWDLSVGWRGSNRFYEIKRDEKAKLTQAQDNFHKRWSGHWKRVESLEQILNDLGIVA